MKSGPNNAMILAAGFGRRMLPLTKKIAKPLVTIIDKPIIHHIIQKLVSLEIDNILINTHHLPELFIESLKIFKKKVKIIYEKEILETGGGVLNAIKNEKKISKESPLFVINGDTFWIEKKESSFLTLSENWNLNKMDVLLVLKEKELMYGYEGDGDFDFLEDKKVNFGKLYKSDKQNRYVFSGLQLLNPGLLNNFEKKCFSLREIYFRAMKSNRLYGIVDKNDWFHISTIKNLREINNILRKP